MLGKNSDANWVNWFRYLPFEKKSETAKKLSAMY